jgi:hypothetical protein
MPGKRTLMFLASVVFAASVLFLPTASARAQDQQQMGEPLRELQEQWRQIMKNEYNPSAITPNHSGKPTFGPERERRTHHISKNNRRKSRAR